jgi:hypothetical protein
MPNTIRDRMLPLVEVAPDLNQRKDTLRIYATTGAAHLKALAHTDLTKSTDGAMDDLRYVQVCVAYVLEALGRKGEAVDLGNAIHRIWPR